MGISVDEGYKHSQELQNLEARRRKQLDQLRSSYDSQLKSKDESFDERIDNLNESFKNDKVTSSKSFEVQIDSAKIDVKEKISEINDKNFKQINDMNKDFDKERLAVRDKFQQEFKRVSKMYKTVIDGKDRDIENIKKNYEKRLSKLSKRNGKEIDGIHESYVSRIDDLKDKQRVEIRNLTNRFKGEA